MSNSIFVTGVAVACAYLLFRFIEMRFILKENKPLKHILKDAIIVFVSTFVGILAIQQFPNAAEEGQAAVFENKPDF